MRGGIVALGVILMVMGGMLFISTSSESIEFLGIKVSEEQVTPTMELGGLEIPLNTLGVIFGFVGFMTFIAGVAASGEQPAKEERTVLSPQKQENSTEKSQPETKSMLICPECKSRIPQNTKFCPECGADLKTDKSSEKNDQEKRRKANTKR